MKNLQLFFFIAAKQQQNLPSLDSSRPVIGEGEIEK